MPKRKLTKTEAGLAKLVKAYNQKITRALQSGRIPAEAAPATVKTREIKALATGMTRAERAAFFRTWSSDLKRIMKPGALQLTTTAGGQTVTRYEAERVKRLTKLAEKRAEEEQARAEKDAVSIPLVGGVPVGEGQAWTRQQRIPKPHNLPQSFKGVESRLSGVQALTIHALGGEWAEYRAELLANVRSKYDDKTVAKFERLLAKISNADLERAYHKGVVFANQDFHYGKYAATSNEIRQMFADMSTIANDQYDWDSDEE